MELTNKSRLPHLVKERIICEYLSGSKTVKMLNEEYSMSRNAINHMVSRHKSEILPTFEEKILVIIS
jgi:transposase-like protein